jgi:CRISPR-associated protein Csm2
MSEPILIRVKDRKTSVQRADIDEIIDGNTVKLVEVAEGLGRLLGEELDEAQRLTTSQIRSVYGMVKRMEGRAFDQGEFLLLKPKLAYAARKDVRGLRILRDVLTWAIDSVGDNGDKFPQFVRFFEAILAYHQAEGGK